MRPLLKGMLAVASIAPGIAFAGCGGNAHTPPPVVLSVTASASIVDLEQGGTVYTPITIVAPTETASFAIIGLPAGVAQTYKESESNPSGQLTLTASTMTPIGTYMPKITVGSSGQTASTVFTLVITAAGKGSSAAESKALLE
jgi:hypothetical protein